MKTDGREPHQFEQGGERSPTGDERATPMRSWINWDELRARCLPPRQDAVGAALADLVMSISMSDGGASNPDARSE